MSLSPWTWLPLRTLNALRTPGGRRRLNRRKSSREPGAHRRQHFSEPLEQRLLLTTIISTAGQGDTVFEYNPQPQDPTTVIRIRLTGNIAVELIGSSVSAIDNRAHAVNVSGRLTGPNPPTDIAGGLGGPGGIDIIGPTTSQATGNPDVNAIAADPVTGDIYAFDIQTLPVQNPPPGAPQFTTNVFLLRLQFSTTPGQPPYGTGPANIVAVNGQVIADITGALRGAGQFDPIALSVAAADFDPVSGLLYFVVRSGTQAIDQLFRLNVNSPASSVDLIPGTFQDTGGGGQGGTGRAVSGITFDQTSASSSELVATIGDDQGGQGGGGGGGGGGGANNQQQPVVANNAGFF